MTLPPGLIAILPPISRPDIPFGIAHEVGLPGGASRILGRHRKGIGAVTVARARVNAAAASSIRARSYGPSAPIVWVIRVPPTASSDMIGRFVMHRARRMAGRAARTDAAGFTAEIAHAGAFPISPWPVTRLP